MPFKDFAVGAVLPAADVDTYLMRQTVMTFATAAARDSALSGVLDDGMVAYLEDAPKRLTTYNGTKWRTLYSEWASFTPSWTNLTVGNGTNLGSYRYLGGDLSIEGRMILGSTSSISSGISLALPNSHAVVGVLGMGPAEYADSGTRSYVGVCRGLDGASSISFLHSEAGASGSVDPTNPFTFGSGDEIRYRWFGRILA